MTPKQERFCLEYLIDLNATQAAIRAGYSEKTANEQAGRLLANVSIQKRTQELQNKRTERTEINADRVLIELGKIAFAEQTQATEKSIPVKMSDKVKALELIGKHLAMFTEKVDIGNADDKPFKTDISGLPTDDLAKLKEILSKTQEDNN